MVAVPTSILSAGFMEMLEKETSAQNEAEAESGKKEAVIPEDSHAHSATADDVFEPPQYCPHCGKKLFP